MVQWRAECPFKLLYGVCNKQTITHSQLGLSSRWAAGGPDSLNSLLPYFWNSSESQLVGLAHNDFYGAAIVPWSGVITVTEWTCVGKWFPGNPVRACISRRLSLAPETRIPVKSSPYRWEMGRHRRAVVPVIGQQWNYVHLQLLLIISDNAN